MWLVVFILFKVNVFGVFASFLACNLCFKISLRQIIQIEIWIHFVQSNERSIKTKQECIRNYNDYDRADIGHLQWMKYFNN